jgi:hypothetical protein
MIMYTLSFASFLLAGLAQSVSGFGFAMVAVPLLAMIVSPQDAVVAATALDLAITAGTAAAERHRIAWGPALRLSAAAIPGVPIGLLILHATPAAALTAVIAVVVTGCTLVVWRGWRLKPTPARIYGAGAVAGLLLTATGTNGPPLVAALQALGLGHREFRATIAAVFMFTGIIAVAGFCYAGEFTGRTAAVCAAGLAGTGLGGWLGNLLFRSVDQERFRRIVLGMLMAGAAAAVLKTAAAL